MLNRRLFAAALAAALTLAAVPSCQAADKLTVFAAASLKNALDAVGAAWSKETGQQAVISYAASSALAKQIEAGAPADIYMSADREWMAYLAERDGIVAETVVELLGNEIVLVAAPGIDAATTIEKDFPLASLLGDGRLAMADVKAVPAGKYGKAALEHLGVWSSVESKVAQAENVRAALKLVATGEAPLGIVYRTDAVAEPAVRILGAFPAASHPPIVYPVAVTSAAADGEGARRFIRYMQSPAAQALFRREGFTMLAVAASN